MDPAKTASATDRLLEGGVLLLLAERADHGYALMHRLPAIGIDIARDPGTLYRRLQALERRGLVQHQLSRSDHGPVRKVYSATRLGEQALDEWIRKLSETLGTLRTCLELHTRIRHGRDPHPSADT